MTFNELGPGVQAVLDVSLSTHLCCYEIRLRLAGVVAVKRESLRASFSFVVGGPAIHNEPG
ncbi:MAG: hypothetical protein CMM07_05330 [Rhodopirellula sp.]|nr:hypothetical protein [Rhodopirellula sp.]